MIAFDPSSASLPGLVCAAEVESVCVASVVVPARNEEQTLSATLDALRLQVDESGVALDPAMFEVLLLLNNCTDASAIVARDYSAQHPGFRLRVLECKLDGSRAHVGTARSLLMNLACERLEAASRPGATILSTDADTRVAPDWITCNVGYILAGAEVVGGVIDLLPGDLERLDVGTRDAYERDRELQRLVARLESLLDPDPADPWPRHLEHFGASLACTPGVYRRAGGMPAVTPLEDVAFVDALRKVDARIRHATDVHISTSARLDGRAEVGLSGQLRHWQRDHEQGVAHVAESAAWIAHRFRTLGRLRTMHRACDADVSAFFPDAWLERLTSAQAKHVGYGRFLELLDCNKLIEETFVGNRLDEIDVVLDGLREKISLASALEHPA